MLPKLRDAGWTDEQISEQKTFTDGRIIVFEVNKDKKLKRLTELGVKGACRSLAMCEGKLVAGLVKTVSPNYILM